MIFYQLTRPASYLLIKDPSKWKIDWAVPFCIMLVMMATLGSERWIGADGLIDNLQGFLQILPGFYLASLAAIATFDKEDLDFELPKPTPKISIKFVRADRLHKKDINLTRRRMLCYLFGYLTFLGLMLYLTTVFAPAMVTNIADGMAGWGVYLVLASKAIFLLFFWQMIVVTIFGLYQLCDRIHQVGDAE